MIEYPKELLYSANHLWVKVEDANANQIRVGITEYLREELPEILSMDLPMPDDEFEMDDDCVLLHLEAGEEDEEEFYQLRAPLSGHIMEINQEVLSNPDLVHVESYKNWIFKMIYDDPGELELLMHADKYMVYIEMMEH